MNRRNWMIGLITIGLGIALLGLNISIGAVTISLDDLGRVILHPSGSDALTRIVWEMRVPRALTALLAGMALGTSGLLMQTVFRNALAGPFVLGISNGASLGVAIVLMLGIQGVGLLPAAGLGGGLVMGIVVVAARWVRSSVSLLVIGLMVGYLVNAVVSLLIHFGDPDRLTHFVGWGFGSFGRTQWPEIGWIALCWAAAAVVLFPAIPFLNAVLLGEENAQGLGLSVRFYRIVTLGIASLLAAVVTVFCGPIGFLGLAVPHLARLFFQTSNHWVLLPATWMIGGVLALFAGWLSNMPGQGGVLPLNAMTALIGTPVVFVALLHGRGRLDD